LGAVLSDNNGAFTRLMQKAKALRLHKYTERPVTAYLSTPVFGAAHPPLYKAGSPKAREEQAAAEAGVYMEELKRKAADFWPLSGDSEAAAAIACACAAAPATPCAARTWRGGSSLSWSAATRRCSRCASASRSTPPRRPRRGISERRGHCPGHRILDFLLRLLCV